MWDKEKRRGGNQFSAVGRQENHHQEVLLLLLWRKCEFWTAEMPSHQYKVTTVAEEYSKNPELKQEDIRNLQDWVAKEAHLPDIPEDQLILFLHSCYYSLEKAKKTIEASYTIRTHAPELFADRDPRRPELQAVWDILQVASLPQRDADGNKVIVVRLCDGDPSKFVHGDVARLFLMAMDTSLREDGTAPGYRFVYDMKGLAFGHLSRINLTILRKYMVYVQEGLRIRMKTIHNINMSPLGEKLIGLMRPLMKKEMVNQMHFHTCDLEPLYAFVPRKILPKDYGGDEASMEELSYLMRAKLEANRDWFMEMEKLKTDETKRKGRSVDTGELFGVEGSFKKLDID